MIYSIATYEDFEKIDIRVGKIIAVQDFPKARKPAYILTIEFGPEIGIKKSSAQLPPHYSKEELEGRLVMAVVNFAPKQIGPVLSEVLTLGVPHADGECVLLAPGAGAVIGSRMY